MNHYWSLNMRRKSLSSRLCSYVFNSEYVPSRFMLRKLYIIIWFGRIANTTLYVTACERLVHDTFYTKLPLLKKWLCFTGLTWWGITRLIKVFMNVTWRLTKYHDTNKHLQLCISNLMELWHNYPIVRLFYSPIVIDLAPQCVQQNSTVA